MPESVEGALERLVGDLGPPGTHLAVPCDVSSRDALAALVGRVEEGLGPIDVLVNNAGIEEAAAYQELDADAIDRFLAVNLGAPMHLTRLVLPGMLARNRGHVVNIASLAGLSATAFGEPYAATKHGLVGFTKSLRASLQTTGSAVSASAICPGFVSEVGMYDQMRKDGSAASPALLGTVTPEAVAQAMLRAIQRDLPDVIVNAGPMRITFALQMLFPRLGEWVGHRSGAHGVFRTAAEQRGRLG